MTRQRAMLLKALALLWLARIALSSVPFRLLRRTLDGRHAASPRRRPPETPERLAWAIHAMTRFVPRPTCLVQAVAGGWLMRAEGYHTAVRVGVRKGEGGGLSAHAWLEHDGAIVIGAAERARFTALPKLPA